MPRAVRSGQRYALRRILGRVSVTRGLDRLLQRRIPGAKGQEHHTGRGGHFLQEDAGAALGDIVARVADRAH